MDGTATDATRAAFSQCLLHLHRLHMDGGEIVPRTARDCFGCNIRRYPLESAPRRSAC